MNKRIVIAGSAWIAIMCAAEPMTSTLRAQDAAPPNVDLNVPELPPASPMPSPDIPDISKLDEVFKQTSLGKQADRQRLHIEWRKLANEVANDPEVIDAKAATTGLRTDFEKRQRLRAYYNLYYERMKAKATSPEMKTAIDALKAAHITQTSQPRVRHETDGAMATPTPSPGVGEKKHHHKRERHQKTSPSP